MERNGQLIEDIIEEKEEEKQEEFVKEVSPNVPSTEVDFLGNDPDTKI